MFSTIITALLLIALLVIGCLLGVKAMLIVFCFALVYAWYANWEIKGHKWHKQKRQWLFHRRPDFDAKSIADALCPKCWAMIGSGDAKTKADAKRVSDSLCPTCRKKVLED